MTTTGYALNYIKAGILASIVLGLFGCIIASRIEFQDAAPFLTLIIGYVAGNGVQAFRGEQPAPLVKPVGVHGRRADDG